MQNFKKIIFLAAAAATLSWTRLSHASLTLNLQFANGSTTRFLTAADVGTSIPISVYATITTAVPVTPGYEGSGANHNGLQYIYYDVLSSLAAGGSAVGGQLTSAILNASPAFNTPGASSVGTLEDANFDGVTDLGPATSSTFRATTSPQLAALPKPSTALNAVWEDQPGASAPQIVISADRLSVSYLVETLYFTVSSLSGLQTTFQPVIPTLPGIYGPASWDEDVPTEPSIGTPAPSAYYHTTGDIAGTSVTFLVPATSVPEPQFASLLPIASVGLLARRRRGFTSVV